MKLKYALLAMLLAGNYLTPAQATLMGRVNSYYSSVMSEEVKKVQDELDNASDALNLAKREVLAAQKTLDQANAAVRLAQQKLDNENAKIPKPDNLTALESARDKAKTVADAAANKLDRVTQDADLKGKANAIVLAQNNLKLAKMATFPGTATADNAGVQEGTGAISFGSVTGGGTPVGFTAYQLNIKLWKRNCKKNENNEATGQTVNFLASIKDNDNAECKSDDLTDRRFVPMYVLLHKTLGTQIGKTSLANDLLDNQNGGLLNIKLTPSIYQFGATGDTVSPSDPSLTFSLDTGIKMVEAPSPIDPKSVSYIGNGYFGITVNAEFAAYSAGERYSDVVSGAVKPSGHLAIGLGVYRNVLNNSTFDSATFASPVPNYFTTVALGYEFQITGTMSLVGMRSLPHHSNGNPLGSFTSLSFRYQPTK